VVDLRQCFGVDPADREHPGKIVVAEVSGGLAGFWVDEIIDVTQCPQQGWSSVPALVPGDIFTRTLLFADHIQLYAEFENYIDFRETGYLRQHIQALKSQLKAKEPTPATAGKTGAAWPGNTPQTATQRPAGIPASPGSVPAGKDADASDSRLTGEPVAGPTSPGSEPDHAVPRVSAAGSPPLARAITVTDRRPPSPAKSAPPPASAQPRQPDKIARQPAHSSSASSRVKPAGKEPATRLVAATRNSVSPTPQNLQLRPASTPAAATRQSHVDYGLWLLLGTLLLVLMAGVYFITDMAGQNPLSTETASPSADKVAGAENPAAGSDAGDPVQPAPMQYAEPEPVREIVRQPPSLGMPVDTGVAGPATATTPGSDQHTGEQAYRATINEDDEGLVIVLDAPEEESLTDTAAMPEEGENTDTPLPSLPAQLSEAAPLVEMDEGKQPKKTAATETSSDAVTRVEKKIVSTVVIHVVVKGDTLWHIARRYIRNPWRYPELARLSKIENPDLIYPGDRVRIIINKKTASGKKIIDRAGQAKAD
jgi:LysM repeat protein